MVARLVAACLLLALGVYPQRAQAQPKRIVSTFPSITETLFAIGAGGRVVGVSTYCRFPQAALALPKIGTYTRPDPEKIALLRPDLVVIRKSMPALASQLAALGIHTAEVNIGSLSDVYSMISEIGSAAGVPDKGEQLSLDIRTHLAKIRAANLAKPRPGVLMVVGRNPGQLTNLVVAGPGAYLSELIEIAGGRNVITDTAMAYPRISLETVVRMHPDVILDMSLMGESADPSGGSQLRQPWLAHPDLPAVRNGMIFGLTSEILTTPGPRVGEAVDLLETAIHSKDHRQ